MCDKPVRGTNFALPRDPLAELEQLRRRVEVMSQVINDAAMGDMGCPHQYGLKDFYDKECCGFEASILCQSCYEYALAQAEGGE